MKIYEITEGTRCWKGYEKKGMKTMFGKRVPNCVKREHVDFCVNCGDIILHESLNENLKKWFKDKWVRVGPKGKIRGACGGKSKGEGKPKCLPLAKARGMGKKGRASAARRKRRKDPNPDRRGKAINVKTKKMRLHEVAQLDPEEEYWQNPNPDTMWVTDKLILASKMGYKCGPAGIDVPESGDYCVRPVVNAYGLGIGAKKMFIEKETTHIPPGFFWCEWFEGRHLSVDYKKGEQTLCVEGFKAEDTFTKWDKWTRTMDTIDMPDVIKEAVGEHDVVNCEYIGGKLIEVHLRNNPDFANGEMEFIPVWEGEDTTAPNGYTYREYPDIHGRIGAFTR